MTHSTRLAFIYSIFITLTTVHGTENDDPEYYVSHSQSSSRTLSDTVNGNAPFYEPDEDSEIGNTDTTPPNTETVDQERLTLESFEQRAQAMLGQLYSGNQSPEEEAAQELTALYYHFN